MVERATLMLGTHSPHINVQNEWMCINQPQEETSRGKNNLNSFNSMQKLINYKLANLSRNFWLSTSPTWIPVLSETKYNNVRTLYFNFYFFSPVKHSLCGLFSLWHMWVASSIPASASCMASTISLTEIWSSKTS